MEFKRIYKYTLEVTDEQTLDLPITHEILSVAEQHGKIVLYAMVISENTTARHRRRISIRGTGHPCGCLDNYQFLGTVNMGDGLLMWHVFIENEEGK